MSLKTLFQKATFVFPEFEGKGEEVQTYQSKVETSRDYNVTVSKR